MGFRKQRVEFNEVISLLFKTPSVLTVEQNVKCSMWDENNTRCSLATYYLRPNFPRKG